LRVRKRHAKAIPPVGRLISDLSLKIFWIRQLTEDPSPVMSAGSHIERLE
jgi:hypothetical protein